MDTTVRNLDEGAYRALRARAVMEGRTVGALMTEAIRGYLARPASRRTSSLRLLRLEAYPPGSEQLSMEIDEIVCTGTPGDRPRLQFPDRVSQPE